MVLLSGEGYEAIGNPNRTTVLRARAGVYTPRRFTFNQPRGEGEVWRALYAGDCRFSGGAPTLALQFTPQVV
jgi:hypothetical protein